MTKKRAPEELDLSAEDELVLDEVVRDRVKAAGGWPVLVNKEAARNAMNRLAGYASNGRQLPPEQQVARRYVERAAKLANRRGQLRRVLAAPGLIRADG